jgi:hypothetical protein
MRSVEPIDVPPYLWTIKAMTVGISACKESKEPFTLHAAMQNNKQSERENHTESVYGHAEMS